MRRWHALFTKPYMEPRVTAAIEARGVEVFAPTIRYHNRRGIATEKPFFPRYILARFDWGQSGLATVQWTPGLAAVVAFDGEPAWLRDDEVAFLRAQLGGLDGDAFMRLKPGQRVRVRRGPFQDFEAVFDAYLNGDERVAILLDVLGRRSRVQLKLAEIERIA